jgi:1-acyl-sn-glycerol-3-phosphate acyltransferase
LTFIVVDVPQYSPFLFAVGQVILRLLLRVFCRWRVEGRENVPSQGAAILACNHLSLIDPPIVGTMVTPRKLFYMAKAELFRSRPLRWLITRLGAYPVRRGTADRRALQQTLNILKAGELVLVFPEGTRSEDGNLQPPELGIALLVAQARVPVIPVALTGTNHVLPRGSSIPRPAHVQLRVGKPITFDDLSARPDREEMQQVAERIMREIKQLWNADKQDTYL